MSVFSGSFRNTSTVTKTKAQLISTARRVDVLRLTALLSLTQSSFGNMIFSIIPSSDVNSANRNGTRRTRTLCFGVPATRTAITAELYKGSTMIDAQGVSLTKDGKSGDDAEYFKMVQSATTTYAKVVLTDSTLNGNADTLHDELRISLNYEVWKIKDGGNTAEIVNTTDNLYIRYRPDNVNTFETLTKGATSTISTAAAASPFAKWISFILVLPLPP